MSGDWTEGLKNETPNFGDISIGQQEKSETEEQESEDEGIDIDDAVQVAVNSNKNSTRKVRDNNDSESFHFLVDRAIKIGYYSGDRDVVEEKVADKIGISLSELEDDAELNPSDREPSIEDDGESIESDEESSLTGQGRREADRFSVTLRKAINDGSIHNMDVDKLEQGVWEVQDIELVQDAIDVVDDESRLEVLETREESFGDVSTDDLIIPGEYRYFPVFGFNINHVCTVPYRDEGHEYDFESIGIDGKRLSWWEEDSITPRHQYVLVNPLDAVANTNHVSEDVPYREVFRFPKGEQLVISDSGGFQMVSRPEAYRAETREENNFLEDILHPLEVLDWQIENADAGVILDHPPYHTEGESSIFTPGEEDQDKWLNEMFYPYLDKTKENAKEMKEHLNSLRKDGHMRAQDFTLLGAIQGHTYEGDDAPPWKLLEDWHKEIDKVGDFDAWALSPSPCTSPGQIALHLAYAHNRCEDAKWFHTLQVGSSVNIALIQFYAMMSDTFVTSDASSHNRGSKYRQFMMPPGFGSSIQITDREDRFERHPCNCKVCKTVEETHGFEYIGDDADSKRNATINMHNLTMQLQSQRILDALMRAEGREVVAGLKMDKKGNIQRFLNPFWKQMRDSTTKSKVRDVYKSMLFLLGAVEQGLQEEYTMWIKEPAYREAEDDEEDEIVTQSILDGGRGADVEVEDENDDEEVELTDEEEYYLGLPTVTFNKPDNEDIDKYYYKQYVTIRDGLEMSVSPTSDAMANW